MRTIGIVLLVIGALALVYGGISYNRDRTVLEMGSVTVTASEHKTIPIPAILGVLVLVGGVTLVMVGKRRRLAV